MAEITWDEVTLKSDELTDDVVNGTSSAEQVWFVKASAALTDTNAFLAATGIPSVTASYSSSRPRCVVTSRKVTRLNKRMAEITVSFADPTLGEFADDAALEAAAAVITESDEEYEEEYVEDVDDPPVPVRNSAGEPFDRGPTRLAGVVVYTIQKYVDATTRNLIRAAKRTNNPDAVTINGLSHAANTLLLASATFDDVPGSIAVWKATYKIKYRPGPYGNGWVDYVLNVGYSEMIDGERIDITQKDASDADVPVPKPWPLNGIGTKKATADADIDRLAFYPYPDGVWTGIPVT